VTGTVTTSMTGPVVVYLTSSKPRRASVPASVTIAAGSSSADFTVQTSRVSDATNVTVSAQANGSVVSAVIRVTQ